MKTKRLIIKNTFSFSLPYGWGVGYVATSRYRWVVEFCVHRKRHRFRTTNFCNAVKQLLYWREIFNS